MATPYSDVFELFLGSIQDYKINNIYDSSTTEEFEEYLTTFLIKAIPHFYNCQKDLELRDDTLRSFDETLTTNERVILSNLMIVEWLKKETNDLTQMQLHLGDKDFKSYAEANNLKEKRETMNNSQEDALKLMSKYSQNNIDWNDFM